MPLLSGDIRFARAANMADVPEGGGPPSARLLTSGRSNEIFPDISEETRTVGRVEIYRIFSVLRNTDTAMLGGSQVILAEPPADPNVSVTLLSLKNPFATRADIAKRIESGMSPGSEWSGYLLENHFETMRSIKLLQRPKMSPPTLGRTYLLIVNEGLPTERRQRITIKSVDTEELLYTETVNNQLTDFPAQVTRCEIREALMFDFPGSPPARTYARGANKTVVRETVYSDTGMFYSASKVTVATQIHDVWLQVASVYTKVVPNSRTEVASVDQRPTARQTVVLAEAPRRVEVGVTPHTKRIKITEANAGLMFVEQLAPMPEPNTVFVDYWAMGQLYTIYDDGTGRLTGAGGGAVSALTGSIQITLKVPPDIGSVIVITHGSRMSYTDRAGAGALVKAPEYAFMLDADDPAEQIVPGALVIKYPSGGQERTVTDNGQGALTGAGTGLVDYPSRAVMLRPSFMPDAGAEFQITADLDAGMVSELITPDPVDPATGFVGFTLAQAPVAGTLQLQWSVTMSFDVVDTIAIHTQERIFAEYGRHLAAETAAGTPSGPLPAGETASQTVIEVPVGYKPPAVMAQPGYPGVEVDWRKPITAVRSS